jgi:hypothetical protein
MILKWNLRSEMGAWAGLIWLRRGTVTGSCKRDNEPSVSIKCRGFLD